MSDEENDPRKRKKGVTSSSSSTSSENQDLKRVREDRTLTSLSSEDVFEMASDKVTSDVSLTDDKTMMAQMKTYLDTKLDQIKTEIISSVKMFTEARLDKLDTKVMELEQENSSLRNDVDKLSKEKHDLHDELSVVRNTVSSLEQDVAEMEQYSRRFNVRVFGLEESHGEDCKETVINIIKQHLSITLKKDDLAAAHRLPSRRVGKPRPMIVRFTDRDTRGMVLKKRSGLKGKGVSISEDLSRRMMNLLNRVKNNDTVVESWAANGKVFAKNSDKKVIRVRYGEIIDFDKSDT